MVSRSAPWALVGRDRELGAIREAIAVPGTRGVLVSGAPGVGKTRLLETMCIERESRGGAVVRVISTREGSAFPLAALAPLLIRSVPAGGEVPRDPVRLLAILREIVRTMPTALAPLMFVDDLPLLDPLSAVMISQLVESRAVTLLATVRTGDPLPEMYHGRWSGDGVVKIDLRPLGERDCSRMLYRALEAPVAAKAVSRLYAVSGGNPLHLRELVMTAVDTGALRQIEEVWHLAAGELKNPILSQTLAARIERLSAEAVGLIRRIAVCRPLELDDLADDVADSLVELEQAGLIEVEQNGADWAVALAHPAYADIIRSQMSRLQIRKILLEQIAMVRARDRGRRDVVRLSIWELEATGRAEPAVLIAAANVARQGHEFELVRRLAAAAVASQADPSAESLLLLGEALRELGEREAATDVLDRAATASGLPEILARVAVARAGVAGHGRNRPDLAVQILAEARDGIPAESDAMSLARAVMLTVWEHTDEALRELDRVDPRRAHTPRLAGLYFIAAVGTLLSAGRPAEALGLADELLPLLRGDGNLFHDGMPLMLRAAALLDLHGPDVALPDATAAMRECLNSGVDRLICYAGTQLFAVTLAAGRPRTAARWARELISVARGAEHRSFLSIGMSELAIALAMTGDAAGARSQLDSLAAEHAPDELPGPQPSWEIRSHAWTLAAEGQISAAQAALLDGADEAGERGQWAAAAELLHDVVRLGGARSALAGLREAAQRCPSPFVERQYRHAAAAAEGDVDALQALTEEWAALGCPLIAAEAALSAATAARRQAMARRVSLLTARGAELAARCQGASTPGLMTADHVDPLSPREREIAAMASRGLRSRDIAESLVVSIRTVDNHLQAVYSKLGISGRRELVDALRGPG